MLGLFAGIWVANVITDWDAKAGKPQAIQRGAYRPLTTPLDRRTFGSGHLQIHSLINLVHLSASVVAGAFAEATPPVSAISKTSPGLMGAPCWIA